MGLVSLVTSLGEQFGNIDIYLFDQLLRERIRPGMSVLDAGCGQGRNLIYLLREGYDVYGVDTNPEAIARVRQLAETLAPGLGTDHFRAEPLESISFPAASVDAVLSSAVLHFACDDDQFWGMLRGSWSVLRQGGVFFCRLASTIGMEDRFESIDGRRFALPDGTERYLVDEPMLMQATTDLGGELLDPLKTTVVQNMRCMTTWVLRKR